MPVFTMDYNLGNYRSEVVFYQTDKINKRLYIGIDKNNKIILTYNSASKLFWKYRKVNI